MDLIGLFPEIFPEETARRAAGKCATCGGEVGEFKDELSQKEFDITGTCQKCQDEVFVEMEE